MPGFASAKAELWKVVTKQVLTGAHGPLPKGVLPVPCFEKDEGVIPPKWKQVFTKHKAKGKLDDWHVFIMQEQGGAEMALEREYPRESESLIDSAGAFSSDVGVYLNSKYTPPRIANDAAVHFKIIMAWVLRGKPKKAWFAPLLYRCYLAGGAPCGWLGRYPKGRLIVYWPHKEEPVFDKE
jgi:hypothetical protein